MTNMAQKSSAVDVVILYNNSLYPIENINDTFMQNHTDFKYLQSNT